MMKNYTYFLFPALMLSLLTGCDYLNADDVCSPNEEMIIKECSELNDDLDSCDPDAEMHVAGCYIAEKCDKKGKCKQICDGAPVPCDQLSEDACDVALNCMWYYDPNNLDKDIE
ncbi:MAG: hypothetical protein JXR76_11180 [Deltaproteobacteria bacterium]|nr:hypothetical protein [Deltaproteobacteria bacterium]